MAPGQQKQTIFRYVVLCMYKRALLTVLSSARPRQQSPAREGGFSFFFNCTLDAIVY